MSTNDLTQHMEQIDMLGSFEGAETMVPSGGAKRYMADIDGHSAPLWRIPASTLKFLPNFNCRIKDDAYYGRVRRLADSMKEENYKLDQPMKGILLNEGGTKQLYIYAGYTRGDAITLANSEITEDENKVTEVTVIVAPEGTTIEDLNADLVTGNNGEKLRPIEVAIVCQRLKRQHGLDNKAIAKRLQLPSATTVEGLLMLIGGPAKIKEMVLANQVSATEAIDTLRKHGDEAVDVLTSALANAKRAGKQRATARFVPGKARQKALAKHVTVLADTLLLLKNDPALKSLPEDTQKLLQAAIDKISEIDVDVANKEAQSKEPEAPQNGDPVKGEATDATEAGDNNLANSANSGDTTGGADNTPVENAELAATSEAVAVVPSTTTTPESASVPVAEEASASETNEGEVTTDVPLTVDIESELNVESVVVPEVTETPEVTEDPSLLGDNSDDSDAGSSENGDLVGSGLPKIAPRRAVWRN